MKWQLNFLINHAQEVSLVKLRWRKINVIRLKKKTLCFYKTVQLEKHRDVAVYFNNSSKALISKLLTTIMKLVNMMIYSSISIPSHRVQRQTQLITMLRIHQSNQLKRLKLEFAIKYTQSTQITVRKNVPWLIKITIQGKMRRMDPF